MNVRYITLKEKIMEKLNALAIKASSDEKLRNELLKSPEQVLASIGLTVKPGITINVVVNDENTLNIVIPAKNEVTGLTTDIDVDDIIAGTGFATCPVGSTAGTCGSTCR